MGVEDKRLLIEAGLAGLSVRRQCELLELDRGSYYYTPGKETAENLDIMGRIDRLYVKWPFLGSRKLVEFLSREGIEVNRKRVQRLMRLMGLEAKRPSLRSTRRRRTMQGRHDRNPRNESRASANANAAAACLRHRHTMRTAARADPTKPPTSDTAPATHIPVELILPENAGATTVGRCLTWV